MNKEKCKICLCSTCFGCVRDNQCARCLDGQIITKCKEYCEECYENRTFPQKNISITEERYNELLKSGLILTALEHGGVNNWIWYDDSLRDFVEILYENRNYEDLELLNYSKEDFEER